MPFWKDWGPTWRDGWCGAFGVPRQVTLDESLHLVSKPIAEINTLRDLGKKTEHASLAVDSTYKLNVGDGVSYDLSFEVDLEATSASCAELWLRSDGEEGLQGFRVVRCVSWVSPSLTSESVWMCVQSSYLLMGEELSIR